MMNYSKLDKKAIKYWRSKLIIRILIILLFGIISVFVSPLLPYSVALPSNILLIAILVYTIIAIIIYPSIEYKQWQYMITDDKVEIRHGIFFIKTNLIPIIRIQDITVKQGPLTRKYELYNVEINLASGSFEIICLDKQVADDITESLRAKLHSRIDQRGVIS